MAKIYCVDCGERVHLGNALADMLGGPQNPTKTKPYYEFEDGFRCGECGLDKKRKKKSRRAD